MSWLEKLQKKWKEVPGDCRGKRIFTSELIKMEDKDLCIKYDNIVKKDIGVRRNYETPLYDLYKDKKVLDIGSGFGISSIQFALKGADITFLDLVQTNLDVLKKICNYKNIEAKYFLMDSLDKLEELEDESYDYFFACGSLMHVPFDFMKKEMSILTKKLKKNGLIHTLSYPKERWIKDGKPSFEKWGKLTDGERTPHAEWYDGEKFLDLLGRDKYELIKEYNFGKENRKAHPFNWIELKKL